MKSFLSLNLLTGSMAALLTLSACASNTPVAKTNGRAARSVDSSGLPPSQDDRHSREVAANTVGSGYGPEYRIPTGSNIPQSYDRQGNTTNAADPTDVIDKGDIRLQRRDNVGDALKSDPSISGVSGF